MKTRSSSAVGTKIELFFDTTSLRITYLDEDSPTAPTTVDVLHDKLKRKAEVEGQPDWQKPQGTPAWEKPIVKAGDKKESTPAIRTMDSSSKLASILKKV
jgi:hypothetical protein